MSQFPEDGLLPPVNDDDYQWLIPGGDLRAGDITANLVAWMMNIAEVNRVVWPAEIDGELRPPPPAHVLDRLVRSEFEGTDHVEAAAEMELRPTAGTVAVVSKLYECDYCKREGRPGVDARYDGPMSPDPDADPPWGWMCPTHYREHSTGRLGAGMGQYLMHEDEVPADVRGAQKQAQAYWRERIARHHRSSLVPRTHNRWDAG